MILGAGLPDGSGAALQYRSTDLTQWSYDGVLCIRLSTPGDEVWTGAIWECPQLFPLDDDWVLLISVWDADALYYVAAAVGDYDGRTFTPQPWQRMTYGNCAHAMTAFLDRTGRRCVMSWLREEPQNNPALTDFAGAHSVASLLETDGLKPAYVRYGCLVSGSCHGLPS
jgi:beta-fructofuranosidase